MIFHQASFPHLLQQIARNFWALGFALVTFDKLFTIEWDGYTIKSSYFCFLSAFLLWLGSELWPMSAANLKRFWQKQWAFWSATPWVFLLILLITAFASISYAELKQKAFVYSAWLGFDLFAVLLTGIMLFSPALNPHSDRRDLYGLWLRYLVAALIVLAVVVHIDYVAHFYGYRGGLIGFNQGVDEWYYYSRPHAFAFEPSYLSMFFVFGIVFLIFESMVSREPLLPRWLAFSVLVLSFNVLILTFARSTLLSFAFIAFILVGLFMISKRALPVRLLWIISAISLCAVFIALLTPRAQLNGMLDRMLYQAMRGTDWSLVARFRGLQVATVMAKETHFLGTGMGNSYNYWFQHLNGKEFSSPEDITFKTRQVVASIWMEVFAELGLLGLLSLGAFVLTWLRAALIAVRRFPQSQAFIGLTSAFVFFGFTAHWFPNLCRTDMWVWITVWSATLTWGKQT